MTAAAERTGGLCLASRSGHPAARAMSMTVQMMPVNQS
jgi:hypothetical protein